MKVVVLIGKMASGKSTLAFDKARLAKLDRGGSQFLLSFADEIKDFIKHHYSLIKNQTKFVPNHMSDEDILVSLRSYFLSKAIIYLGNNYYNTVEHLIQSLDLTRFYEAVQQAQLGIDHKINYRYILQFIGSEIGRQIHPDFWSIILIRKLRSLHESGNFDHTTVYIDDLRFINEFKALERLSEKSDIYLEYIILDTSDDVRRQRLGLTQEQFEEFSQHISETQIESVTQMIKSNPCLDYEIITHKES
nr:MAG TPA: deoxynucleoside monophosphate kinase [Bacteriophage sp.]